MSRLFLFLILNLVGLILNAQSVTVFHEKKEQGFVIYATNNELYPVSVLLNLDIENLSFTEGKKEVFVVPAKTEKFKIGELTVAEARQRTKFGYKYKTTMGDVTLTNFDKTVVYDLPFRTGKSYRIFQGYNGTFSHQNENSLDFTMPEGTEISAARDGIVVQVVQNNTVSCPDKDCGKFNNYITIMHADGTFASYLHIKFNGSNFKLGDRVKQGDIIAYSGNVGWSSGPHLHFVCFLGGFGQRNTIKTLFRINKEGNSSLLKEGETYLKDY